MPYDCSIQLAPLQQRFAKVQAGQGKIRFDPDRPGVIGKRVVLPAGRSQGGPEIIARGVIIRRDVDRTFEDGHAVLPINELDRRYRQATRHGVQIPGSAARMSRVAFMRAMRSVPSFRSLMYAYVNAFLEQILVSVACNGAHSIKQRLARWLLMMSDRCDNDAMPITQNLLAAMLAVQRPTITNAARELEHAGLLVRGRREVTILDRQGLREASCECYQLVRKRVTFHLPKTYI